MRDRRDDDAASEWERASLYNEPADDDEKYPDSESGAETTERDFVWCSSDDRGSVAARKRSCLVEWYSLLEGKWYVWDGLPSIDCSRVGFAIDVDGRPGVEDVKNDEHATFPSQEFQPHVCSLGRLASLLKS